VSDVAVDEDDDDDEPAAPAADDADEGGGGNGGGGGGRGRRALPPIQDIVKKGQDLLVQVSKEPIGTKGPRVTAHISLPGRFLVYMPGSDHVGVSRKIEDREERARLRALAREALPPKAGGVIVRTVGEELNKEVPDSTYFRRHDVSDEASWQALVEDANERFGPVNVLVNNAGILRFAEVEKMELEEFMLLVNINQVGCFLGMKAVARTMRKNGGGSIINASSVEGLAGMASCTAYAATKWAIPIPVMNIAF